MAKRGLVLAGGGARGAYHIGVWKALRELGVDFSIVTGASVGALNAALMAQGEYDTARRMWLELSTERILPVLPGRERFRRLEGNKLIELAGDMARYGGSDLHLLAEILDGLLDQEAILRSPVDFGFTATWFPRFRQLRLWKEQVPPGQLVSYLIASMTYFPVLRMHTIDGRRYIDGAYTDNMPADLALERGAEELILVDLNSSGIIRPLRADVPVTFIASHWKLGPALHFAPACAGRNLNLGYLDTMRAFHRLEGELYAFPAGDTARNAAVLLPALRELNRRTGIGFPFRTLPTPYPRTARHWREAFVLGKREKRSRFGRALTMAAELAGMLSAVPPDRRYGLEEFNELLLDRRSARPAGNRGEAREDSRLAFRELRAMLRRGVEAGQIPPAFYPLAAAQREAFYAAYYLTALELRKENPDGS